LPVEREVIPWRFSQERIRYATSQRAYQQEKRKESKVRELISNCGANITSN